MALILVVEDDDANQELVTRFLRRDGHTVIHSIDGLSAIELAQAHKPDLILMDLNLPVLDGWEATRRIKTTLTPGISRSSRSLPMRLPRGDESHAGRLP